MWRTTTYLRQRLIKTQEISRVIGETDGHMHVPERNTYMVVELVLTIVVLVLIVKIIDRA